LDSAPDTPTMTPTRNPQVKPTRRLPPDQSPEFQVSKIRGQVPVTHTRLVHGHPSASPRQPLVGASGFVRENRGPMFVAFSATSVALPAGMFVRTGAVCGSRSPLARTSAARHQSAVRTSRSSRGANAVRGSSRCQGVAVLRPAVQTV
jgi:hypothetical protein